MFGIFVDASPNTTKIPNMKTLVIKTLALGLKIVFAFSFFSVSLAK